MSDSKRRDRVVEGKLKFSTKFAFGVGQAERDCLQQVSASSFCSITARS